MGVYVKAEKFLNQALKIWETKLDKTHPDYAFYLDELGLINLNLKRFTIANKFFAAAFKAQRLQELLIFGFASEAEKQSYVITANRFFSHLLSLQHNLSAGYQRGFSYDAALFNRARILNSSQQLRQSIYNSADTIIQNKYNNWIDDRQQLSFWYAKPIAERPDYVKDLEDQANTLEKELTHNSSEFKNQKSKENITWQTIQQNLKSSEAAIEFVDFHFGNGKRYTDSTYYIALLLRKNQEYPKLIKLFKKNSLTVYWAKHVMKISLRFIQEEL